MKVIRVLGPSGAGKTTLIERLVGALSERGRVATVKSIHHDVEVDDPGKDTHRHRVAGAGRVVGLTPSLTFSVEPRGKDDHPREAGALYRALSDLQREGYDYVLVEGFSRAPLPAIAVGEDATVDGGYGVAHVTDATGADLRALLDRIEGLDAWSTFR